MGHRTLEENVSLRTPEISATALRVMLAAPATARRWRALARAEAAGSRHGHGIGGAAEGADRGGLAEAAPGAPRDRLAAHGLPAVGFTLPSSIRIARPLARDRAEERKTPGPEGLHALPGRAGLIFRVGQGDLGECGAWAAPDGLGNARARPRRVHRLPTL